MTDLTDLSLAEMRDGLRARSFSAKELAEAHVAAVEGAQQAGAADEHALLGDAASVGVGG